MPGESVVAIIALIMCFGAPAAVIITIAVLKHRQKMELARHGINPNAVIINYPGKGPLLWGMIFLGLGIAAVASALYDFDHDLMQVGFLFLGVGIALLIYWFLTVPERKRAMQLYEERMLAERDDFIPNRQQGAAIHKNANQAEAAELPENHKMNSCPGRTSETDG